MQLAGLDLNLLIVLDALFTEKSVTRAGERIHLSQSATSAALSRLRQFFADELLVAVGNQMMLTPHAIGIQEQVRDIILRAEAIARNKTAFVPATATRHFRLIMSDYPATVLMPRVLAQAQKIAPHLTFEILPVSDPNSDELERGEADLRIMPQQWISRRHPSENLYEDRYVCVVWSENKTVKRRFSRAEYLRAGHIGVRFPGRPFPVMEEWLFEQLGRRRRVEVVAPTFNLSAHLVIGTDRVATMHAWLARECAQGGMALRIVNPPIEMPHVVESMQWHQYLDADAGIVWLRKVLKSVASQAGHLRRR
ncbi:MAG TPA: LysR family transcriptional regulator [Bryobacteraceae bacterium]|nr:LysR family transcriptional regulator [Bryobacteraceae bacterium]